MVALESSKLFMHLPATDLAKLKAEARELRYGSGQSIFKTGDPGDGVYIVESGRVQISTVLDSGERHEFAEVPPGEVFGEMTLLDNLPRSATATAQGDTRVCFLPREAILPLLRESPELSMQLVQDISRRLRDFNHQYVRELLKAERLALVGRFASSIVHDLKNPLCIIGLAAELMAEAGASADDRAAGKQRIAKQVDRITDLVNDILEFTRGSSAAQLLAPMDYARFIHTLIAEYEPELSLKNVTLRLDNPPPAEKVFVNPKRLGRVFNNLFANAADMMPSGGVVALRFQTTETAIITEIADEGPGIPDAVKDRIFEAFVTHGKPKGTGLGLSIVQRIIDEHGGKVTAANQTDGGAVFSFTLPRRPQDGAHSSPAAG